MKRVMIMVFAVVLLSFSVLASADDKGRGGQGLSQQARQELSDAGVDQYLGEFAPAVSSDAGDGWIKHTYAPNYRGDGPLCIAGTPYSIFTKGKNPKNLLIFMQGGGACWQDFYFCNVLAEDQEPPPPPIGIWSETSAFNTGDLENPMADYSVVYMPYCDGSVFTGDKDVVDPNFPFGPVRFHRGMENASAGIDLAKEMFPDARKVVVAGSSAGGVGASAFAPFLTRMKFGNQVNLSVFNDAGPVVVNPLDPAGDIPKRAFDWDFGKFYPASCTECSDSGQQTALIQWRLDNDSTIRESFYSTDGDGTNRFFTRVPTQELYRGLIVSEHGKLNDAHPDRYKRFIRSGDDSHTALQTPFLYYYATVDDKPLYEWISDFLKPGRRANRENNGAEGADSTLWVDLVEDFVPLP